MLHINKTPIKLNCNAYSSVENGYGNFYFLVLNTIKYLLFINSRSLGQPPAKDSIEYKAVQDVGEAVRVKKVLRYSRTRKTTSIKTNKTFFNQFC